MADPRQSYWTWDILGVALYLGGPLLRILLSRRGVREYGLCFKIGAITGIWFAADAPVALLAAYPGSHNPAIAAYYPLQTSARAGGPVFAAYLGGALLYLFAWEFIFRSYLIFALYRSLGWSRFVVEATIFGLAHRGKPPAPLSAMRCRASSLFAPAVCWFTFLLHGLMFVALNCFVMRPW